MSSVAVFVFLLDNLAGFNNAINNSLFQNARNTHSNATPVVIKNCDPFSTEQILGSVSQDLDQIIVPAFLSQDENKFLNETSNERGSEVLDPPSPDNFVAEQDASLEGNNKSKFDFTSIYEKGHYNNERKNISKAKNETKIEFPHNATFLVAIFETLANVTAQTCAGTLLNSRWVLTAANCIDVLSNTYANNTNMTDSSIYTIVAGSSKPLSDGSAHNVTQILVHPDPKLRAAPEADDTDASSLALMRIEPEVQGSVMKLMADEVTSGDVKVYGWILSKNESDLEHDRMESTSVSSQILNPAECRDMYSYKNNDVLCLKDVDTNVTQLSTGGPVLYVHEGEVKMLSVVQTDDHVFVSYSVEPHYDWINHTISNNK